MSCLAVLSRNNYRLLTSIQSRVEVFKTFLLGSSVSSIISSTMLYFSNGLKVFFLLPIQLIEKVICFDICWQMIVCIILVVMKCSFFRWMDYNDPISLKIKSKCAYRSSCLQHPPFWNPWSVNVAKKRQRLIIRITTNAIYTRMTQSCNSVPRCPHLAQDASQGGRPTHMQLYYVGW